MKIEFIYLHEVVYTWYNKKDWLEGNIGLVLKFVTHKMNAPHLTFKAT